MGLRGRIGDGVPRTMPMWLPCHALRTSNLVQPVFSQMREGRLRESERLILGHTANVLVPSSQFLKVNHEDYFLIAIHKFGFQSVRDSRR